MEQLKEKVQLEAKIEAQKAELDAQLPIKETQQKAEQEAKQEAVRKENEALVLKQEADGDYIAEGMKDFEENTLVTGKVDNIVTELRN